jgi:hypothetical protein
MRPRDARAEGAFSFLTSASSGTVKTRSPRTTIIPITQPAAKAGAVDAARGEKSRRITAIVGKGLTSTTPIAVGNTSAIAAPMAFPQEIA